jgi:hypothetical protein
VIWVIVESKIKKMMRFIVFYFFMGTLPIFAQTEVDTLRQLYDRQTLMLLNEGYMQDAEIKPIGASMFKQDPFTTRLKTVPAAYAAYKKANVKMISVVGILTVEMPALMIGLGTINISNATPKARNFTYGALGIGASLAILNHRVMKQGETQYFNAIWLYNRAVILRGYADSLQREKIGDLYDKKTIRLIGSGFVQNGVFYKRGVYNQKMTAIFADNVLASRHLKQSKRAALLYKPAQSLGFLGAMYGLGHFLTAEYHTRSQLKTGLYAMLIGGGLGLISIPLQAKADDHLQKAVWFYNREALTGR